ncbi:MAG: hypothetical protein FD180_3890 [Planctomycetota bacterium]|nr:MAG: hypothetical protein FD180_3890 [Planctomycetota bacterium]
MKVAGPIALVAFVAGTLVGIAVDRRRARTADVGVVSGPEAPAGKLEAAAGGDEEVQRLREEAKTLREQLAAALTSAGKPLLPAEEAKKKAEELRKKVPALLEAKDGKGLISLMRELASLGEPGYDGALEIAELLKNDVMGPKGDWEDAEEKLGIDGGDFWKIWTGRMVPMLAWSLAHPERASSWFRANALETLSWDGEVDASRLFAETLTGEKDPEVAAGLAEYLDTVTPDLSPLLVESARVHRDNARALPNLLIALGKLGTPESVAAIEELRGHADANVRRAAEIEMKAIRPPVAGAYINQFWSMDPEVPPALQRGDIVVSWNGAPVQSWDDFTKNAARAAWDGTTSLVVHRGNELVTVDLRGKLRNYDGKYVAPGK